jgi:uncharacterized protein DUF6812
MAEGDNRDNRTRVVILAGPYRIKGEITLVTGSRLTDYMVESKGFIALTQAEVWDLEGRLILSSPFLDVSRSHVVIISPD